VGSVAARASEAKAAATSKPVAPKATMPATAAGESGCAGVLLPSCSSKIRFLAAPRLLVDVGARRRDRRAALGARQHYRQSIPLIAGSPAVEVTAFS
jgi:hypothetical protein